jgi:hypothetical protein
VANDHLNCLEVEVGVTLVGALAPSAHYTHTIDQEILFLMRSEAYGTFYPLKGGSTDSWQLFCARFY